MSLYHKFLSKFVHTVAVVFVACFVALFGTNAAVAACNANEITIGNDCYLSKFSVTTTSDTTSFVFAYSAKGVLVVDWGDGTASRYFRSDTTSGQYSHNYSTAGSRTIRFGGVATEYNSSQATAAIKFGGDSGLTPTNIASVSGSLGELFPTVSTGTRLNPCFYNTFYGATNLTSIPSTLFSGLSTTASDTAMFQYTFSGCTGLISLPDGLFSSVTTGADYMFQYTFSGCTGLTSIPGDMFENITTGTNYMFNETFSGCTGLTSIPGDLFENITIGAPGIFNGTFRGCTGLTGIPGDLFENITTGTGSMFNSTFYGCTGLTTLPDGLFSSVTTGAVGMFNSTFQGCTGLTSIPDDLFENITTGAGSMFNSTFRSCTGLTALPENLFSNITTAANYMFQYTFYGCSNLTGYIPPSLFAGLVNAGHPTASSMFDSTFYNTGLVTSCPVGTKQYNTGYESSWSSRVSCEPVTCAAGEEAVGGTIGCARFPFSITTTSDTTSFAFNLSAKGTFYIDWGDGSALQIINRANNTSETTYTHNYSTAGSKTIRIGGTPTEYNSSYSTAAIKFGNNSSLTPTKIASVSGSLGELFPTVSTGTRLNPSFYQTFYGATNLTSISPTLFSGLSTTASDTYMFNSTFYGCTGLTSLPNGLFSSITIGADYMFYYTFYGCSGLTSISGDVFENLTTGASNMFNFTFYGCTGLTSLPNGLFSHVTTGADYMFQYTFSGCTGLTTLPDGLFSSVTTGAVGMFNSTFQGCTGLTSIPDDLFENITTGASNMFNYTFSGCTGLTSLPNGLFSHVTTGADSMFYYTFSGCTGLTALPENLFSGLTTVGDYMFSHTFYNCSNLAGYIPPSTFTGLVNAGHPTASSMFYYTFDNTRLVTSCPVGTKQYITGYEGSNSSTTWNGKVSCEPVTCAAGETAVGGTIGCARFPFSITTTSDTTSFAFNLSAKGTFYIDWGDGSALQVINRTNSTSETTYTHNYSTAGSYTIRFGGTPTEYNSSYSTAAIRFGGGSSLTPTKIASVSGSLGALFPAVSTGTRLNPSFYNTFYGATNLTSISPTLFSGLSTTASDTYMFYYTFYNCTSLISIPDDLFENITTGADYMFYGTFSGCTGLTTLPDGLFSSVTTGAVGMFYYTFYNCTGLTALPENLFSGLTTVGDYMFQYTFYGCSNLTGYIPPSTFTGLVNAGAPTATNLWGSSYSSHAFYNTKLVTTCPVGTKQYFTGYEGTDAATSWYNKVSCEPVTCAAGQMAIGGVNGCITPKFSVTTTSDTTAFRFYLGVSGYVDWGDGETSLNTSGLLSHTYATAGSYTIRIAADVPSTYNSGPTINFYYNGNGTPDKIASVSGSLGELFPALQSGSYPYPYFSGTFQGATHLTQIPSTLFSGVTGVRDFMFDYTFNGCTGLTSLPDGLFSSITTSANYMFRGTFMWCTGLTSIPGDLFENITTGANYMFDSTFSNCSGLTSLPNGLFSSITTVGDYMFSSTFSGCTNLTSYIPSSTFTGLVNAGSPTASSLWSGTFNNTQLATSCPADMHQYITGYEGTNASTTWNGRVSCAPGCATGLVLYSGRCREMCSSATTLRAGNYSYPLFADKTGVSSPILHFKRGGNTCYVFMEPDVASETGMKMLYNNTVYHAVDPR